MESIVRFSNIFSFEFIIFFYFWISALDFWCKFHQYCNRIIKMAFGLSVIQSYINCKHWRIAWLTTNRLMLVLTENNVSDICSWIKCMSLYLSIITLLPSERPEVQQDIAVLYSVQVKPWFVLLYLLPRSPIKLVANFLASDSGKVSNIYWMNFENVSGLMPFFVLVCYVMVSTNIWRLWTRYHTSSGISFA